jgi:hypothetical protein
MVQGNMFSTLDDPPDRCPKRKLGIYVTTWSNMTLPLLLTKEVVHTYYSCQERSIKTSKKGTVGPPTLHTYLTREVMSTNVPLSHK